MRMIKLLSNDMECNINEAEEKISTAYALKDKHPNIAAWYKEMASAHLNFNTKGHELVAAEIRSYRESPDYMQHPEYADGMKAVWDDKHADMIAKTAKVRAMIDTFK